MHSLRYFVINYLTKIDNLTNNRKIRFITEPFKWATLAPTTLAAASSYQNKGIHQPPSAGNHLEGVSVFSIYFQKQRRTHFQHPQVVSSHFQSVPPN